MKHEDYTIGWVCALPFEAAAAYGMLDEQHDLLPSRSNDGNNYTFGRIGQHNVVVACLPYGVMGKISAARVAERMLLTFPALRFALMVGIGGGVPSESHDIRLGDVIVSKPNGIFGGVIQYDYGKTIQEGRFTRIGSLNRPPDVLLTALTTLEAKSMMEGTHISHHLFKMMENFPKMTTQFTSPGPELDSLYKLEYDHPQEHQTCSHCDPGELVHRKPRLTEGAVIHYGLIASGDQVMKHGRTRDRLRQELNILCFEMEASGLMDAFPCLVIRGVCDYSDSHKNDRWQPFAAATAAAYAKELLSVIPRTNVIDTRLAKQVTESNVIPTSLGPEMVPGAVSQENIPREITITNELDSTSQHEIGVKVAVKYALASVPYTLNEVKLGCLVLDKRRPNQDSTGPLQRLRDGIDYTWRHQVNFNYFQQLPEKNTVVSILKQLFSSSTVQSNNPDNYLWSREGRIYELTQPRELFQHMCRAKEVRDWLMNAYDDGYSPHFIVGYRTLVDATTTDSIQYGETSTDILPEQHEEKTFKIPGERIFATSFRQVHFRWSKPNDANEAYLAKDTVWMATPVRRGAGETDAIVEVDLCDDGGASNNVFVTNESKPEEYYIPDDENSDNEVEHE